MKAVINNLRSKRADEGFTLVELLVVVVIIGVLVAIAIPMYGSYRKGAANKSAQSDVRGAISTVEQYYTENNNAYPDDLGDLNVSVSDNNEIDYVLKDDTVGGTGKYYVLCAKNSDGGAVYVYNSLEGKSVAKSDSDNVDDCLAAGA
jgi:type IV pilus assembly protein PilA